MSKGALMIAATKDGKKIPEVCIYMDGLLLRANRTIKGPFFDYVDDILPIIVDLYCNKGSTNYISI